MKFGIDLGMDNGIEGVRRFGIDIGVEFAVEFGIGSKTDSVAGSDIVVALNIGRVDAIDDGSESALDPSALDSTPRS